MQREPTKQFTNRKERFILKTQEESSPKACRISTLFAGDFLVRVFQSLESEGALKMPEERCSLKSLGLPALKDLAFSSLKTFPDSYRMTGAGRLRPSSVRWMNWGIRSSHSAIRAFVLLHSQIAVHKSGSFFFPVISKP